MQTTLLRYNNLAAMLNMIMIHLTFKSEDNMHDCF